MVGRHSVMRPLGARNRGTTGSGGFSLIEMLVATAVFSFGMGGMAALMLSSAGGMAEAEHHSIANLSAAAMAATVQLSPAALEHAIDFQDSVPPCFEGDTCSAEEWLGSQYQSWQHEIERTLPEGAGVICHDSTPMDGSAAAPACDNNGPAAAKVFWQETRHAHDDDRGNRRVVVHIPQ